MCKPFLPSWSSRFFVGARLVSNVTRSIWVRVMVSGATDATHVIIMGGDVMLKT